MLGSRLWSDGFEVEPRRQPNLPPDFNMVEIEQLWVQRLDLLHDLGTVAA